MEVHAELCSTGRHLLAAEHAASPDLRAVYETAYTVRSSLSPGYFLPAALEQCLEAAPSSTAAEVERRAAALAGILCAALSCEVEFSSPPSQDLE